MRFASPRSFGNSDYLYRVFMMLVVRANSYFTRFKMESLSHKKMSFEEFCAAAISPHQLEAREDWDQIANTAFEYFEQEGNRVISLDELSSVRASVAFQIISCLPRNWIDKITYVLPYAGAESGS